MVGIGLPVNFPCEHTNFIPNTKPVTSHSWLVYKCSRSGPFFALGAIKDNKYRMNFDLLFSTCMYL